MICLRNWAQIEDRPTLQVMPGDTVSLVVRPKDKPDQAFVDVASLLSTLQSLAPATGKDGAHHVFLAPPDYPVPAGAQRFHVTYVAPNTIAAPSVTSLRNQKLTHPFLTVNFTSKRVESSGNPIKSWILKIFYEFHFLFTQM